MLSILIPTYNYNAYPLALEIEKQALAAGIIFEIICLDDGSMSEFNNENEKINLLVNSKFIISDSNRGRTATRYLLSQKAKYDWLLLLDSDVIPKDHSFLANYIKILRLDFEAFFGGFLYPKKIDNKNKSLRHKFGKKREQKLAVIRNKDPYKVIISANFIIKKNVYQNLISGNLNKTYGMDYLFGASLKKNNVKVFHIDNGVFHLGIDTNDVFLSKTEKAVLNLYTLYENKQIDFSSISLLKAFNLLKRTKLVFIYRILFKYFKPLLRRNLKSSNPNLIVFDLYRLGLMSSYNK